MRSNQNSMAIAGKLKEIKGQRRRVKKNERMSRKRL
jgi:hypothetical protein